VYKNGISGSICVILIKLKDYQVQSFVSLKAQSGITFSIDKEIIKEEDWVRISITNNNKEDILCLHIIS
jgi:hypothetical protein